MRPTADGLITQSLSGDSHTKDASKRMLDKGDIKPVVIPADAMKLFGKSGAERDTGP